MHHEHIFGLLWDKKANMPALSLPPLSCAKQRLRKPHIALGGVR
jgi:hypothetical protein